MSRSFITLAALLTAVATTFISLQAQAVQRTHVSAAFGADSNTASNCSAAAPCRFFAAAMSVTDNNGEVIVLDSGGYGAVTITQSISLIAPTGVYAGISVFPGANGVTIATAGINVVLRGLTINGQGGNFGINMTAGARLTVENCLISNLAQTGINVNTAANVRVTDTTIRDSGSVGLNLQNVARAAVTRAVITGHSFNGIVVQGTLAGTITTADIADSTLNENYNGAFVFSDNASAVVRVSIRDSRAVGNTNAGVYVQSSAAASATLSASNSVFSNNNSGIFAFNTGSKVWASGNTISDNDTGLYNSIAVIESAGNNAMRNNRTADTNGTIAVFVTK